MSRGKRWLAGASTSDILSVSSLEYIFPAVWQQLYNSFPSFLNVLKAKRGELEKAGITPSHITALVDRPQHTEAAERLLKSKQIRLITLGDDDYPESLKEINDPPLWLFVRGKLGVLKKPCLTAVGSRKPSAYALSAVKSLLPEALASQICLISGLAYGIDKAIHQAALEGEGKTVAVLAGGLDSIYPIDHHRLAEKIVEEGGALISEYPPLSRPKPYRFPIRNRILAGLSPVTVVVEANIRSGSLTTARSALDYNREVWAVPGDISRKLAEGTNFLIKQGAALLDSPDQIAHYYGLKHKEETIKVDSSAKALLELLSRGPQSIEQLMVTTQMGTAELLGELTRLELVGYISRQPSGQYARTKK